MENTLFEIIVVEDSPYDAEMIVDALKLKGLAKKVMVLEDGSLVLDYIFSKGRFKNNESKPNPKLILLDLKMPKVNGIEALKQLKSNPETQHIPVVVLTSSKEEIDIKTAYTFGANSYIVKPVDFEGFEEAVGEVGLYWLLFNELAFN
jgi:two-component system, response regulator